MRNHKYVVSGLIRQGDKVLICQRNEDDAFGLLWEFPGGCIEEGETQREALIREIKEELAVTIQVENFVDIFEDENESLSITVFLYTARITEGKLSMRECRSFQWCAINNLFGYFLAPLDRKIAQFLNSPAGGQVLQDKHRENGPHNQGKEKEIVMKRRLEQILKKGAVFKKKVVLSSGKESDYYIDVRRVSLSSEGLYLIANLLWERIANLKITAVGGPTLGADPIVAALCMRAYEQQKLLKGFLVRKEPKKHGQQNLIEGLELERNERVVLLDDVATSGKSIKMAYEFLTQEGVMVDKIMVVVDRNQGASQLFKAMGCDFEAIFNVEELL